MYFEIIGRCKGALKIERWQWERSFLFGNGFNISKINIGSIAYLSPPDSPQDNRTVELRCRGNPPVVMTLFKAADEVHMVGVAAKVQFSDFAVGTGVVEQSERAELVGDQHVLVLQLQHLGDGVLPVVARVDVHGLLVDHASVGAPLDVVLDEDGVDASELLALHDPQVLRAVLEQEVAIVNAKVKELDFARKGVRPDQLEAFAVDVKDAQLVLVAVGGGHCQHFLVQG